MSWRDVPLISTLIVLAAVVTMIGLGFWQLDRMEEKDALLASYGSVPFGLAPTQYPVGEEAIERTLYRPVRAECVGVTEIGATAGTSATGTKGWAAMAQCLLADGQSAPVALGWSAKPDLPTFDGGAVTGILAPGGRIVADPALAGLEPLAKPDPADLPNNHLAYAGQWFFFALTALAIYTIALRTRIRSRAEHE
ncbi:MAG: SURF1 family protein [Parerythrobacter sp.]